MNWWQALVTILLGNIIVLVPILLNSHPGTKYGIPFPVFARAAYGTRRLEPAGADARAGRVRLVRHPGLDRRRGAADVLRARSCPGWADAARRRAFGGHTHHRVALVPAVLGPEHLHHLPRHGPAAPGRELGRAVRARDDRRAARGGRSGSADGLGPLLAQPGKFHTLGEFLPVFVPSLTAMIGFWATLSLNMPDFTRFGRSQREQVIGQVVALPTTMTRVRRDGRDDHQRDGDHLRRADLGPGRSSSAQFTLAVVVAIAMFTVVVATLAVNIAANVVSPANDFANAFPQLITFKTRRPHHRASSASLMLPWKLLADPSGYIFNVAARLLGRPRLDRRRAHRRLLVRARDASSRLADLYLPDGGILPAAGTGAPSRRRCSAARSPGSAWSSRRCSRSTTTPGSSASGYRPWCTWRCSRQRRPWRSRLGYRRATPGQLGRFLPRKHENTKHEQNQSGCPS